MKKLKRIYQETIFLTWLGMTAQQIADTLSEKKRTITGRHSTLIKTFTHPDEPQSMLLVVFKARHCGLLKKLYQKFALRFAREIKQAAQLPQELEGFVLEE